MLIIALVIVALLYVGLYLIYEQAQGPINQSATFLARIESVILFPRDLIFRLLYLLILLTLAYLIWDFFFSAAKRAKRRMDKAKQEKVRASNPIRPQPRR
jgi:hypothetical protein